MLHTLVIKIFQLHNKHIKTVFNLSLFIREMQMKTSKRCHNILTGGDKSKKTESQCGWGCGSANWCNHYKTLWQSLLKQNVYTAHDWAIPLLGICPAYSHWKSNIRMFILALIRHPCESDITFKLLVATPTHCHAAQGRQGNLEVQLLPSDHPIFLWLSEMFHCRSSNVGSK